MTYFSVLFSIAATVAGLVILVNPETGFGAFLVHAAV